MITKQILGYLAVSMATLSSVGEPRINAAVAVEIPILFLSSLDAFELLKSNDRDLCGAVTSISVKDNSITLDATHPHFEDIRAVLHEFDRRLTQKKYSVVITETQGDGGETVLSSPTIYSVEGRPATIHYPLENGRVLNFHVEATDSLPE